MKVLVTGAAGFIGSTLAHGLLDRGDEVVGIDNLNAYYDVRLKHARLERLLARAGFLFQKLDIVERKPMSEVFAAGKFDSVVHLAAQAGVRYSIENPSAYVDANLVGFMHVLEGCRHTKVGHLVFASSSSVYGPWGRPDMALFKFTEGILAGRPIPVFNRGEMVRDFTYVDDIVEGVVRVMVQPAAPAAGWSGDHPDPATSYAPWRIFNIGNNRPVKLMRYIEVLEQCLGRKAQLDLLPMQAGDVPATFADVSELHKSVGYKPQTPIEVGVRRFAEWYQAFYRTSA